jgi:23S rRNA (cytidine1920-2'-O)/16S rRNA (cytidine1409-2'-O)-methyltransferase
VLGVASAARRAGLRVRDVVASPLPGPGGNVEYFVWLAAPGAQGGDARVGGTGQDVPDHDRPDPDLRALVERAVAAGPTGEGSTWSSS